MYDVKKIAPNKQLSAATGCTIQALKEIVRKGQGAYYSSGSRPNQTGHSWGIARLASSITSGKSAVVEYHIIEKGCNHKKQAFTLAKKAKEKQLNKPRKTFIYEILFLLTIIEKFNYFPIIICVWIEYIY